MTNGSNIDITEYLDGFQYKNQRLQFFPQAEGYVNNGDNGFEYVYNYTDHLGNVRLSYKDNNGSLEILKDNNHYPFGLKHKKYNSGIRVYQKSLVDNKRKPVQVTNNQLNYNYKYQGQHLDAAGVNLGEAINSIAE